MVAAQSLPSETLASQARIGGKSMDELILFMTEVSLVGWGWHRAVGREPAPGSRKSFGDLIKAWARPVEPKR